VIGPDTFDYRTYDEEFQNGGADVAQKLPKATVRVEPLEPSRSLVPAPVRPTMFGLTFAEWDRLSEKEKDAHFDKWLAENGARSASNRAEREQGGTINGVPAAEWRRLTSAEKTQRAAAFHLSQRLTAINQRALVFAPTNDAEPIETVAPPAETESPSPFTREALDAAAERVLEEIVADNPLEQIPIRDLIGIVLGAAGVDRLLAEIHARQKVTPFNAGEITHLRATNIALEKKLEHFEKIKGEHTDLLRIVGDNDLGKLCRTHKRWHASWLNCPFCEDPEGQFSCEAVEDNTGHA
jgi:hypothetical protein